MCVTGGSSGFKITYSGASITVGDVETNGFDVLSDYFHADGYLNYVGEVIVVLSLIYSRHPRWSHRTSFSESKRLI